MPKDNFFSLFFLPELFTHSPSSHKDAISFTGNAGVGGGIIFSAFKTLQKQNTITKANRHLRIAIPLSKESQE
jgi:hypothetical protein